MPELDLGKPGSYYAEIMLRRFQFVFIFCLVVLTLRVQWGGTLANDSSYAIEAYDQDECDDAEEDLVFGNGVILNSYFSQALTPHSSVAVLSCRPIQPVRCERLHSRGPPACSIS